MVPPFDLLVSVEAAMGDLDPIGPSLDRVDLLQRLERVVFDGNNIRSFIDNRQLNWLPDRKTFERAILSRLSCGEQSAGEVLHQLTVIRKRKLAASGVVRRNRLLNADELLEGGWLLARKNMSLRNISGVGTTYDYAFVGREWARFFCEYRRLDRVADNLPLSCLRSGQALAIEDAEGIRSLVPPTTWRHRTRIATQGKSYRFLLTRDLPEHWFNAKPGPRDEEKRRKKRDAIKRLNELYQRLLPTGKRPVRKDVLAELHREFESISNGMFDEIWKEADIEAWRRGGRPADKDRYRFEIER